MLDFMIQCRRDLHQIPELDCALEKTCAYVKRCLEGLSCKILEITEGSVCAYFDEGKEDAIAFRADMDALPIREQTGLTFASQHEGKMHACGHDGHTAMLLGLAQLIEAKHGALPHNVLLVFQPAEESTGGAKKICESGIFEQYHVKCIFGFHLWPKVPFGEIYTRPGPMMAKSSETTLYAHGKSVHISRYQEGLDTIEAAMRWLQGVYQMEQSEFPPEMKRLLRFGHIQGGSVRNAVAADTVVEGTLRAFTLEDFDKLKKRCEEIANEVAEETSCDLHLQFSDGYPPVTNDAQLLAQVEEFLGEDAPKRYESLVLSTEDFSWYQQYLPGVFMFLGVGDTEELHSAKFTFDERVLSKGLSMYERLLYLP